MLNLVVIITCFQDLHHYLALSSWTESQYYSSQMSGLIPIIHYTSNCTSLHGYWIVCMHGIRMYHADVLAKYFARGAKVLEM